MNKARVMVVEDEGLVALTLEQCLQNLGHDVTATVASGEEAVRKAAELDPDLVFMDIRLKGDIDGVEAANQIKDNHSIPVIYLTAYSDDETLGRARTTEPYGYIVKPFDSRTIKSAIEMALYKAELQSKLRQTNERLSAILNCIGDGVIVSDFKGEISYMNPNAQKMTGYTAREATGSIVWQVLRLVDGETGSATIPPFTKVILGGEQLNLGPYELVDRAGSNTSILVNIAPIRNEARTVTGMVIAFRGTPDFDRRRSVE